MLARPADRVIGELYLLRWHVIPRNRFFNIYLHKYLGSDDDRACHDHPWYSVSFLLKGRLEEIVESKHVKADGILVERKTIRRFLPVFRSSRHAHRLILKDDTAWTLFITGPVVRQWGFWCGRRWVHHNDFTDEAGTGVGAGCG